MRVSEEWYAEHQAKQDRPATFQEIIEAKGFTPSPKASKYRNKKVVVDGITFDSKREASRWTQLRMLEKAGKVKLLVRQKVFVLAPAAIINGRKKPELRYCADFTYFNAAGELVVEDAKGALTDVFKIKRHLMKTVHNIDILLT